MIPIRRTKPIGPARTVEEAMTRARKKIVRQYCRFTKEGHADLDLTGIQGVPGSYCYFDSLKYFDEENPPKVDTLLSRADKARFDAELKTEIKAEIEKCEALIEALEKLPAAVEAYLGDLEQNLTKWRSVLNAIEKQPVIGRHRIVHENESKQNENVRNFIQQTEEQIAIYSVLLAEIQKKK